HLREALLAVIPKRTQVRRKKRGRRVVAHAPIGFLAVQKPGKKNFVLIVRPTAGGGDAFWRFHRRMRRGCRGNAKPAGLRRRPPRLRRRQPLQNFAPTIECSGRGMSDNHFARTEPLAFGNARFFKINQTRLGTGYDEAVVRYRIAKRAQTVAVELRSDNLPI